MVNIGRHIKVMSAGQERVGADLVMADHPQEGGPVTAPIINAQSVGMRGIYIEQILDGLDHAAMDLVKNTFRGIMQSIVQIKKPDRMGVIWTQGDEILVA